MSAENPAPQPLITEVPKNLGGTPDTGPVFDFPADAQGVDWSKLKDGQFTVHRADGSVEQGGWSISKIIDHELSDGRKMEFAVLQGWSQADGSVEMQIPLDTLVEWQQHEDPDITIPRG